jgi:hypothetical protein
MDIKLADVLHALKKYSVQAIENAITYAQEQNCSDLFTRNRNDL